MISIVLRPRPLKTQGPPLLCPSCHQEKGEHILCPFCGVDEAELLLRTADQFWWEGNAAQAIDHYAKYLTLRPDDFEVAAKKAGCLRSEALRLQDPAYFEQADKELLKLLGDHWDWQTGHRYRIELYSRFGKLKTLLKEYDSLGAADPRRAGACEKIIKTIQLLDQFNLICPNCKNEKFEADICPKCGLGERDALLKAAERCWKEQKRDAAVEFYGKYLELDPDAVDVAKKKAACLVSMAIDRKLQSLFDQANKDLLKILQEQWDWETGHRYRVDLYANFDRLKLLLEEYDKIHRRIPSRTEICDKVIRNIQLVSRFRDDLPLEPVTLADAGEGALLWRSFWPLLVGLLGGGTLLKGLSYLTALKGPNNNFKMLIIQALIGFCFLILVLWCSGKYKKIKSRAVSIPPKTRYS